MIWTHVLIDWKRCSIRSSATNDYVGRGLHVGSADRNAHLAFCFFVFAFCFLLVATGAAFQMPLAELSVPSAASSDDCDHRSGAAEATDGHWTDLADLVQPDGELHDHWSSGHRCGEASHPGPPHNLVIGCTNPGGLRSKEALAIAQGPGIWTYSETQLSAVTQVSSSKALKYAARLDHRLLRTFFCVPATLRSRSDWAGTWTGVACTSDFSSKQLQIDWPPDLWQSGRIMATQHQVGRQNITVVSLYGIPRGPTWPQAASLMNEILAFPESFRLFVGHHITKFQSNCGATRSRQLMEFKLYLMELGSQMSCCEKTMIYGNSFQPFWLTCLQACLKFNGSLRTWISTNALALSKNGLLPGMMTNKR